MQVARGNFIYVNLFTMDKRSLVKTRPLGPLHTMVGGQKAIDFFFIKNEEMTRSWSLDWRGCFGHGIKWNALSSCGL
jgi:hypothetical protein